MAIASKSKSSSIDKTITKPLLKWAGGKRWLLPKLGTIWAKHQDKRLVEPFCGGLAVSLGLNPKEALLSDINDHAINFYRWVQRGLIIDFEMFNEAEFYYASRAQFNQLVSSEKETSAEAARLFYYLNRTGYNGLCRFNKQGKFNVPFGLYKSINYRKDFSLYCPVMKTWQFVCGDFAQLPIKSDDFIYADPPYDVEFRQYSKEGFDWQDQERLALWLAQHKGPVIVSNQATDRVIALYKDLGFKLEFLQAPRKISCTGDRTSVKEMFAYKGI